MLLHNFPVLRLLIPYIFGIFLGYFTVFNPFISYFCLIFIFIALIFVLVFRKKTSFLIQKWVGLMLLILQLFAGYLSTSIHLHQPFSTVNDPKWIQKQIHIATLVEPIQIREKTVKTIISIDDQHLLLYIQKDSNALKLQYGDVIVLHTQFKNIDPPKNPDGFDYQNFMKRKGVIYTGYVNENQWVLSEKKRGNRIRKISISTQQHLSKILENSGLSGDEYSVAAAILLGNDDTMEPDLKSEYSNAGVSHILCVSGMHVGIIFMILNYLLIPFDWIKRMKYVKPILLFLAIWSYANITGLSPSVVRSATMFSFVLLGTLFARKTNIYQSLYASLFIILLAEPLLIFDLGFQLSYLAVFGIVIFQKPIASMYTPKTKIGNYFWSLTSVSLAAQLSTFPISIFYFHQFPNYFLLANLTVIFLSFCVMLAGTTVIGVSFIPLISQKVSLILEFLIRTMNQVIHFIQMLPGAITENISISFYQMVLIYFIIGTIFIAITQKHKLALFFALGSFLGFLLLGNIYKIQQENQSKWTVFSIPKTSAILFHEGKNGILISDSIRDIAHKNFKFSIKNYLINNNIKTSIISLEKDTNSLNFNKIGDLIFFKGKTILIAQHNFRTDSLRVDYVYLYRPKINIEQFLSVVHFDLLIMDETISLKQEKKWIVACEERNLKYYSVRERGAFISELK